MSAYWQWRKFGQEFKHPVRYPNGYDGRSTCKSVIIIDVDINGRNIEELLPGNVLSIIRQYGIELPIKSLGTLVYFKTYARLARMHPFYSDLKLRLSRGENLQIVEVDGPPNDNSTPPFELVKNVIQRWIHSKYSFGHGICLAICLLDLDNLVYNCI